MSKLRGLMTRAGASAAKCQLIDNSIIQITSKLGDTEFEILKALSGNHWLRQTEASRRLIYDKAPTRFVTIPSANLLFLARPHSNVTLMSIKSTCPC